MATTDIYRQPSPRTVYLYALMRESRIEDLESSVLKNNFTAYLYAKDIIKGRWIEAEQAILNSKDEVITYLYARDVIKDRWIEGEHIIVDSQNQEIIENYNKTLATSANIEKQWADTTPLVALKEPLASSKTTRVIAAIKNLFK